MIKIEMEDSEPVVAQLRTLTEVMQRRQAEDAANRPEGRVVDMSDDGSFGPAPTIRFDDVFREVVATGAAGMLADGRYPNSVMNLSDPSWATPVPKGTCHWKQFMLPAGVEILTMTASPSDVLNWSVRKLSFASLNLISDYGEPVPLSVLAYLTRKDLLSPFAGRRTVCDLMIMIDVICKTDGAAFEGFNLFVHQEEQVCRIQNRLEPKSASGVSGGIYYPPNFR
jgi:hypothetical protein